MLGVSDFTIRRMIQRGELEASITSKKQGYIISLDSLLNYAKEHKPKIGTLAGNSIVAEAAAMVIPTIPILGTLIKGIFSKYVDGSKVSEEYSIIQKSKNFFDDSMEEETIKVFNDPLIIDKIIARLKAEIEDLDVQIEYQNLKIAEAIAEEDKLSEEKNLLQIKQKKTTINKDIKDLELQKALIKQTNQISRR